MSVCYRARCGCGFVAEAYIGIGFESERFPCYCIDCQSFVNAEIQNSKLCPCQKCGSNFLIRYDSEAIPAICDIDSNNAFYASSVKNRFPDDDKRYFCPRCAETNLRFVFSGFWD